MNKLSSVEIDRFRAVLHHILPMAKAEAIFGSQEWKDAIVMIESALAQEAQEYPPSPTGSSLWSYAL